MTTPQEPAAEGRMPVGFPIIFSAPMVRALLDDRKSITRRLAWRERRLVAERDRASLERRGYLFAREGRECFASAPSLWQRVKAGDRLWVRERGQLSKDKSLFIYAATPGICHTQRTPYHPAAHSYKSISSRHMPRWASRITLIVMATKIERVQEISEDDAVAEGIDRVADNYGNGPAYRDYLLARPDDTAEWFAHPVNSFESLWRSLHDPDAWDANPECVCLSFRVLKANIDSTHTNAESH